MPSELDFRKDQTIPKGRTNKSKRETQMSQRWDDKTN